jgi:ribosomal protein S3AE
MKLIDSIKALHRYDPIDMMTKFETVDGDLISAREICVLLERVSDEEKIRIAWAIHELIEHHGSAKQFYSKIASIAIETVN